MAYGSQDVVVCAANPPEGSAELWGGERQNGLPYAEHVHYVREREVLLSIRTVLPETDPPPVIGTVESFGTVLVNFRLRRDGARSRGRRSDADRDRGQRPNLEWLHRWQREEEQTPSREVAVLLDGASVPGARKDFADWSVALFTVDGVRIFCTASAERLDGLALRRAGFAEH